MTSLPLAIFGLGPTEMIVVGVVAVLLFGNRLPEVARSLGKSMTEFKNGMRGVENELRSTANTANRVATRPAAKFNSVDDRDEPTAPKFEPPAAEPQAG